MTKAKMLCLLLVLLMVPAVWPGEISPYLADRMEGMLASDNIDAVVMMSDQANIPALDRQLRLERATLAERNKRVIEALQDEASLTQPAMISFLDDLQSRGLIKKYKMLWVANMFIVSAIGATQGLAGSRSSTDGRSPASTNFASIGASWNLLAGAAGSSGFFVGSAGFSVAGASVAGALHDAITAPATANPDNWINSRRVSLRLRAIDFNLLIRLTNID